jgi:hypothetical protein
VHSSFAHPALTVRRRLILAAVALALLAPIAAGLTAAPANAGTIDNSVTKLRAKHQISKNRARWAVRVYQKSLALNRRISKPIRGKSPSARAKRAAIKVRRAPVKWQIRMVRDLAASGRLTGDRVIPVFSQLSRNTAWFRGNGPRPAGTDKRFKGSRIIFQYFSGTGWQFHPLSNFAKLNAVWTVDTAPSRRAQRKYARELIHWGVKRGNALTWEYYFDYEGSPAPWISAISQGAAIQSLARVAYRMHNKSMMRSAKRGLKAFATPAPLGLKVERDGGYHYLGYSGNTDLIILNMFLSSLHGIHDYAQNSDDKNGRRLFQKGVDAALVEAPKFDTGSWSKYSLSGEMTDRHYHDLTITFLGQVCHDSKEKLFCNLRDKFASYR